MTIDKQRPAISAGSIRIIWAVFCGTLVLQGSPLKCWADAPSPCIVASLSPSGTTLVLNDLLSPLFTPKEGNRASTGNLFILTQPVPTRSRKEIASVRMWRAIFPWSIPLGSSPNSPSVGCPQVIATDDSKRVVVIDRRPISSTIWIFRDPTVRSVADSLRRGDVLRKLSSSDLWPEERHTVDTLRPNDLIPGATFELSSDQRRLLCSNSKGEISEVDLSSGLVKSNIPKK
jgi:hypothetical protein